jgi:hypothetical protein
MVQGRVERNTITYTAGLTASEKAVSGPAINACEKGVSELRDQRVREGRRMGDGAAALGRDGALQAGEECHHVHRCDPRA